MNKFKYLLLRRVYLPQAQFLPPVMMETTTIPQTRRKKS